MGLIHYTFSDSYARKDNWLSSIDVRVKLVYIVSLLTINLIAKNIVIPVSFLFASLSMLLSVKVPFGVIIRNMFIPSTLAILILAVKGLHEGEKIWLSFSIAGYDVVLREEGLYSGLIIFCKVLGGISLVIVFSFTTTISRLCAGLKWLRVPETIIELLSIIYRYIFLFLDEVSAMLIAQKSRLGHSSWKKTINSLGVLGGMLIIRAFTRSERTYEAMRARGYEGGVMLAINLPALKKKEYFLVIGMGFLLPMLVYTGDIQVW